MRRRGVSLCIREMIVTKQNAQSEQAVAVLLDAAAQNLQQFAPAQSAFARSGVDLIA